MNNDYIVNQVKFLADHAVAAERFAWLFGDVLDVLWKATAHTPEEKNLEISFNTKKPGEFEIFKRLKHGDPPYDSVKRLGHGDVIRKRIVFNLSIETPKFLTEFFKAQEWKINRMPLKMVVD